MGCQIFRAEVRLGLDDTAAEFDAVDPVDQHLADQTPCQIGSGLAVEAHRELTWSHADGEIRGAGARGQRVHAAEAMKARRASLTIAERFRPRRLAASSAFFRRSRSTPTEITLTPLPILGRPTFRLN